MEDQKQNPQQESSSTPPQETNLNPQQEPSSTPPQETNLNPQQEPSSTPPQETEIIDQNTTEEPLSKSSKLKRYFFQVLIVCLLAAASIAVITVLVGSFNDVLARSLATILVVAVHAALSFSYISETDKRDQKDGGRSIELFNNTVFTLIAISFITSIFAVWELIGGEITFKLYAFYFVLLFATLHADSLYRIRGFEEKINTIVITNYLFMSLVVAMLAIVIFSEDSSELPEFFFRVLAALAIVDATMTITAIMMHKLYIQKHPELSTTTENDTSSKSKSFWKNPFVVLLLIYLAFQIIGSLVALLFI